MSDFIVFAMIGLLTGATARLLYPERDPLKIAGTMLLGMGGSLLGGLLSWAFWAEVDGQLYPGALLMSLVGAVLALVLWPSITYARGKRMAENRVP